MPIKVNVWVFKGETYVCSSCSPTIEVKADGKDRAAILTLAADGKLMKVFLKDASDGSTNGFML